MSTLQNFNETTTIHGIYYIFQRDKRINHILWSIVFAFCLALCIWQSTINAKQYLTFNVKTKDLYNNYDTIKFPAITIWNKNLLKRSVFCRPLARLALARAFAINATNLYTQVTKTCAYNDSIIDDYVDKWVKGLVNANLTNPSVLVSNSSFAFILGEKNFVKCWLKQYEVDCKTIVLTSSTDNYLETHNLAKFSINLDTTVARTFLDKTVGLSSINNNYNETTMQKVLKSTNINEQHIKLLLNVNLEEHCTFDDNIWYGSGFEMKLHDPKTLPSNVLGNNIELSPGFQFNIALKPVYRIKKTEHLGKCLSSFPLYMFPNNSEYLRELCYIQCRVELSWDQCNCLLTYILPAGQAFFQKHGITVSLLQDKLGCFCNRPCADSFVETISRTGIDTMCPYCKPQCMEIEYNYQMTATRFSPKQHLSYYANELNIANKSLFSKNYLVLNVFFESTSIDIIEEMQLFTIQDVFVFIGNNIGLFLGMSFMSFGDIFYFTFRNFQGSYMLLRLKEILKKSNSIITVKTKKPQRSIVCKMRKGKTRIKTIAIQPKKTQFSTV